MPVARPKAGTGAPPEAFRPRPQGAKPDGGDPVGGAGAAILAEKILPPNPWGRTLERVTISLSDDFADELTAFMAAHSYGNRSEAIRDLARIGLERSRSEPSNTAGHCVATLSYVFDHHTRELSKRLTEAHHGHHDLQVATLHVHLDHESCLEVAVLRGPTPAVRDFAERVIAERGVTYGAVRFVPVDIDAGAHTHGSGRRAHSHIHPKG